MKNLKNQTELELRLEELKKVKAQELADYLHTSIPKTIVDEKVELLEKIKATCIDEEKIAHCDEYSDNWVLQSDLFRYIDNEIKRLKGIK